MSLMAFFQIAGAVKQYSDADKASSDMQKNVSEGHVINTSKTKPSESLHTLSLGWTFQVGLA